MSWQRQLFDLSEVQWTRSLRFSIPMYGSPRYLLKTPSHLWEPCVKYQVILRGTLWTIYVNSLICIGGLLSDSVWRLSSGQDRKKVDDLIAFMFIASTKHSLTKQTGVEFYTFKCFQSFGFTLCGLAYMMKFHGAAFCLDACFSWLSH